MSQSNLISSTSSSGTGNHHYSSSQYLNSTATGLSSGIVGTNNISQSVGSNNKRGDIDITRKEKRQYRKRKHKIQREKQFSIQNPSPAVVESTVESDEEDLTTPNGVAHINGGSESEEEGPFTFKRSKNCYYQKVNRVILY